MTFSIKFGLTVSMVVLTACLAFFCFEMPAIAFNPDHLVRLQTSNRCVNCDLSGADLSGKHFRGADLQGADLQGANLRQTLMMAVNLKGANLQEADLSGANLVVVDFQNARLNRAITGNAILKDVRFCHTITPDGRESNRDCPS